MKIKASTLFCCGMISLASCTDKDAAKPAAPAKDEKALEAKPAEAGATSAADLSAAKDLFAGRCTPCHGAGGAGDGAASASLTPKPANFTSPDWQKSVTDEHIEKIIVYGGMAVGKSAAMPPNPDLDGKPVVKALRAHLRNMKK